MRRTRALEVSSIVLGVALLAVGCAHGGKAAPEKSVPQRPGVGSEAPDWNLHSPEGERPAELEELMAEFYGGTFKLDEIRDRIDALLQEHSKRAELHEMAMLAARMNGESHESWYHGMRAATDTTSPLTRLYLWMLASADRTAAQRRQFRSLLKSLVSEHPDPEVRSYATWLLVDQLEIDGNFERAAEFRKQLGFVDAWDMLGPFEAGPNPYETSFLPGSTFNVDETYEGIRGEISVREVPRLDADGQVSLDSYLAPDDQSAAYLSTYIRSPSERTVDLRFSASSGVLVFINGTAIRGMADPEHSHFDNYIFRAPLAEGWNWILVKTVGGDEWDVGMRATTPEGLPLDEEFEFSTGPHSTPDELSDSDAVERMRTPLDFDSVTPKTRRLLWRGRQAGRTGPWPEAQQRVDDYLQLRANNPLALYFGLVDPPDDFPRPEHRAFVRQILEESDGAGSGLLLERGKQRLIDGDPRAALGDFRRAVDRESANRAAWIWMSKVQDDLGWQVERCQMLHERIDRWISGELYWQLGDCYDDRDLEERALRYHDRARALRPGSVKDLRSVRYLARNLERWETAVRYGRRLVEAYPVRSSPRVRLASIQSARGHLDAAEKLYRSLVEQRPGWDKPYRELADLAVRRGNRSEAIDGLEKARMRAEDDETLHSRLAYHRLLAGSANRMSRGTEEKLAENVYDRRWSSKSVELEPATSRVPGDEAIEKALQSASEVEPSESAHWVDLLDDEVTVVHTDGTATSVVTRVRRALDAQGRDAVVRTGFPRSDRVEILRAHTVTPNGDEVQARSIREEGVRFRQVDVGSTVVLQYVYERSPFDVMRQHYFAAWKFQKFDGYTRHARWLVVAPPRRELSVGVTGDVQHRTQTIGGRTFHTMSVQDRPPLAPADHALTPGELLDRAFVSSIPSWETYVDWELARLPDALDQSDAMKRKAKQLTDGAELDSKRGRADVLAQWVQQEIRYERDYEDKIARVIPHAASKVFDRRYGDCKDKTVAFLQMAKSVGIDVRYAMLQTREMGRIDRDVAGLQFNHAVAYVPKQEGIDEAYFVDLTTEYQGPDVLPTSDQATTALVIDPDSGEWQFREIPTESMEVEYAKDEVAMSVRSPDNLPTTWTRRASGNPAARIRATIARTNAGPYGQDLMSRMFSGGHIEEVDMEHFDETRKPLVVRVEGDTDEALQKTEEGYRLRLPQVFDLHEKVGVEHRDTALDLGGRKLHQLEFDIDLGEGVSLAELPQSVEVEGECILYRRSVQRDEGDLTVTTRIERRCAAVSPDQYTDFREDVLRASRRTRSVVEFQFDPYVSGR